MIVNPSAFWNDAELFEKWLKRLAQTLPGGWGLERDWLPSDGSAPATEVNGPQDEPTILSTYPGRPPVDPHSFGWTPFGWMPGSEAFYHGYVEACRREYEFLADGVIAQAMFRSQLLQTLRVYYEQDAAARRTVLVINEEIEAL